MHSYFLILIFIFVSVANSRADYTSFLIVEHPAQLTIFNNYEQFLEKKEKLPPFTPFQILDEEAYLSDNITPVIKAGWRGQVLLILKDQDGNAAGIENSGFNEMLRKCVLTGDTLVLQENKNVTVYQTRELLNEGSQQLRFAERIIRLFNNGRLFYIQRSRPQAGYGWIKRSDAALLNKAVQLTGGTENYLSEDTKSRVISLIESVNESYAKYFKFLNNLENRNLQAPLWQKADTDSLLIFTLSEKEIYGSLKSSTAELLSSLNLVLSGSGYTAVYDEEQGTIFIKLNNQMDGK